LHSIPEPYSHDRLGDTKGRGKGAVDGCLGDDEVAVEDGQFLVIGCAVEHELCAELAKQFKAITEGIRGSESDASSVDREQLCKCLQFGIDILRK